MNIYVTIYSLLCFYLCCIGYQPVSHAKPLSILVAVEVFPCSTQIFILNQITGLIDAGHNVHILAFRDKEYGSAKPVFPTEIAQYNLLSKTHYNQMPDSDSFDIIYCQFGSTANKLLPLLEKYNASPRLISCFRGGDASTAFIKNPHTYDLLFEKADFLFPVCKHFAKRLIKHGCPPEKVIVHHSGIDCDAFTFNKRVWPQDNKIHLITVGRLYKEKGHEYAIKAVAQLAKNYPNIKYKIIGDGPYKTELQKLIDKLKMQDTIELAGLISHNYLPQELEVAHIFLLTPITLGKIEDGKKVVSIGMEEGIPNALMEAMASGIPVIGTNHAGIPELIEDGISGFLVPERNVHEICKALEWFIAHPDRWGDFGHAGRRHVLAEHNITTQLMRLNKLLEQLGLTEKKYRKANKHNIITSSEFLKGKKL